MRSARWLVVLLVLPLAAPIPTEQAVVGQAVAWADPTASPSDLAGRAGAAPDDGLVDFHSWIVEPPAAPVEEVVLWSDWGPAPFGPPSAPTKGTRAPAPPLPPEPAPAPGPPPEGEPTPQPAPEPAPPSGGEPAPPPPSSPPPEDEPAPQPEPEPEPQPEPEPEPGSPCLLCLDLDLARLLS